MTEDSGLGPSLGTDEDGDGYPASVDCDDQDPSIHPDADELCDGKNNDCDAGIDEDAVDATLWYPDLDGDGYGAEDAATLSCEQPPSYDVVGGDCEDSMDTVHPGAVEICGDLYDNDCDPSTVPCEITDGITETRDSRQVGDTLAAWSGGEGAALGWSLAASEGLGDYPVVAGAPGWDLNGSGSGGVLGLSLTGESVGPMAGASGGHEAGSSLAIVEDTDGDGHAELLVGIPGSNTGGTDSGQGCLVLGPLETTESLADSAVCFLGEAAYDQAGISVSAGGDLDADGVMDLVIGSTGQGDGTDQSRGAVYIVSSDLRGSVPLEDAQARLLGPARYDRLGATVLGPIDVDGDGQEDLLTGASTWDGNDEQGGLFVQLGPVSGDLELTDADVWIEGPAEAALGAALSSQDLDGDGYTDVILGGPGASGSAGTGQVWVFMGPLDGPVGIEEARAEIQGEDRGAELGAALATGDLDGDGTADLAVGAPRALLDGMERGRVVVFYGPVQGTLLPDEADFEVRGHAHGDELGRSIVIHGEPSEDGRQGLWIGAPGRNGGAGMVLLTHGG